LNISFILKWNWACKYTTFISNRRRTHFNHYSVDFIGGSRLILAQRFSI